MVPVSVKNIENTNVYFMMCCDEVKPMISHLNIVHVQTSWVIYCGGFDVDIMACVVLHCFLAHVKKDFFQSEMKLNGPLSESLKCK